MGRNSLKTLIISFLLFAITINLLLLNLKVFSPPSIKISSMNIFEKLTPTPSLLVENALSQEKYICPQSCISLIEETTRAAKLNIGQPQETEVKPARQVASKEYYIPLGSGNTTKTNWEDLIATETTIDPGNYGKIKEAYFTASLRNPTQNGFVETQLYNVTDKHPVWGSHVIMNGPSSQTITSDKITLSPGNKLYRVQLKSTLSYPAYLDNAKIRIITE